MNQLPAHVDQLPTENAATPAKVAVVSTPAEVRQTPLTSVWATFEPQVQAFAPVAAQAAGRAVVDSMSSGLAEDQDVLDQATLELVQAAGVIARDQSVPAEMRCGVVTEMGGLVGRRSVHKDRAEVRGYAWAEKLLTGAVVTGVLAVVVQLFWRRPR